MVWPGKLWTRSATVADEHVRARGLGISEAGFSRAAGRRKDLGTMDSILHMAVRQQLLVCNIDDIVPIDSWLNQAVGVLTESWVCIS